MLQNSKAFSGFAAPNIAKEKKFDPVSFDKSNPLWAKLDAGRAHVTVEICYCSALDECWTLRGGGISLGTTTETPHCPTRSDITFQQ